MLVQAEFSNDDETEICMVENSFLDSNLSIKFAGNGVDLFVGLSNDQLQKLADQLSEWGWTPSEEVMKKLRDNE